LGVVVARQGQSINDFLHRLHDLIDWSIFSDLLHQIRYYDKKSKTGRLEFGVYLSLKIAISVEILSI
jgi:hypothetical protein